ncbi:MAG: peroxiredoxin family protein [Gammaproteobacteria bacterium]
MRAINSLSLRLFSVLFALVAVSAHAHDAHSHDAHTEPAWGPKLGTSLPADLMVKTHEGEKVSLKDLVGDHGLAIAFVRSADWCPFCKRQIIELNKSEEEFSKRGFNLVSLSYDSVDILKTFAEEQGINYTLVSDEKSSVIDAFGIRNEEHEKGSSGYGIPHPGIMVFDGRGRLVAKFAEEGYRKRPPVEDVLSAVEKLNVGYSR